MSQQNGTCYTYIIQNSFKRILSKQKRHDDNFSVKIISSTNDVKC